MAAGIEGRVFAHAVLEKSITIPVRILERGWNGNPLNIRSQLLDWLSKFPLQMAQKEALPASGKKSFFFTIPEIGTDIEIIRTDFAE